MSETDRRPLVMVVDDDPDVRQAIADVMGDAGYRTLRRLALLPP
jgi:FixJ family two-component response regulator